MQYAPVSGTIEEINGTLSEQPGLLNKSPEDKGKFWTALIEGVERFAYCELPGWLCKIKLSNASEVRILRLPHAIFTFVHVRGRLIARQAPDCRAVQRTL